MHEQPMKQINHGTLEKIVSAFSVDTVRADLLVEASFEKDTHWGLIAIAIATGVVVGLQVGKMPPSLPFIRDSLGLGLVHAGWVASLINFCGAIFGLLAGLFAYRFGPAPMIFMAMTCIAAGNLLGAGADSWESILLARLFESIGFVGVVVAAPSFILAVSKPRDRSLALGIWSVYLPIGAGLAMLAAPSLIETVGWRGFWRINFVIAAFGVGGVIFGLSCRGALATLRASRGHLSIDVWTPLKRPATWLFGLCFGIYALQFDAVLNWLPSFMIESEHASLATATTWGAVAVTSNAIGNLVAAWLMHGGVPRWRLMAFAFLAMMICAWLIFAETAPDMFRLPASVVFMLFGGILPATCFVGATAQARNLGEMAVSAGIVLQLTSIGGLIGPPILASTVTALGGWDHGYVAMWVFGLFGLLMTVLLLRKIDTADPAKGDPVLRPGLGAHK